MANQITVTAVVNAPLIGIVKGKSYTFTPCGNEFPGDYKMVGNETTLYPMNFFTNCPANYYTKWSI
jgi:hypothetical protein